MGNWDEYTGRYHPSQKDYQGYEVTSETEKRLNIISEQVRMGYPDEKTCRKDVDWLETTLHRLQKILDNEQSIGYNNVTLKHDLRKINSLVTKVSEELERLDP